MTPLVTTALHGWALNLGGALGLRLQEGEHGGGDKRGARTLGGNEPQFWPSSA